MTASVYRFFDGNGVLLYVGITVNPSRRICQHKTRAVWFDEVSVITIQKIGDIDLCRKAEKHAIKKEHPKYNIKGASR